MNVLGVKNLIGQSKGGPLITSCFVRYASTGGNKNPKQPSGKHHGFKRGEGSWVFPGDTLIRRQQKLWLHPGLNVTVARKYINLVAMKEGVLRMTTEKPDLNFEHSWVKTFYAGREGQTFYKKYLNVIPRPQHTRFRCIDQV